MFSYAMQIALQRTPRLREAALGGIDEQEISSVLA